MYKEAGEQLHKKDPLIISIVKPLIKNEVEPDVFSREWEWDQMCNYCAD